MRHIASRLRGGSIPPDAQKRLVENIAGSMKGVPERIIELQISRFEKADPQWGLQVAEAVGLGKGVKQPALV